MVFSVAWKSYRASRLADVPRAMILPSQIWHSFPATKLGENQIDPGKVWPNLSHLRTHISERLPINCTQASWLLYAQRAIIFLLVRSLLQSNGIEVLPRRNPTEIRGICRMSSSKFLDILYD